MFMNFWMKPKRAFPINLHLGILCSVGINRFLKRYYKWYLNYHLKDDIFYNEGLMLKLKLWYSGHLMWRTDSLEKTLILGKIEGRRRRGQQRMRWSPTRWTWVWVSSGSWWWTGKPVMLQSMGSQRIGHDWATELKMIIKYTIQIRVSKF